MGKSIFALTGILSRLRRNNAGNTIAIVAAALIPLAGMIGGGLDISRGYLAQTRLQQACDAGVLAGRKVMGSSGVVSTGVRDEVRKYVGFNFPNGYLGSALDPTTGVTPTLGANDTLQLTVTATIPTVVMRLFGKNDMSVTANCTSRNDYSNIDIVLVLDTTGSMACKPERSDTSCGNWINNWLSPKGGKTMTVDGRTVTYVQEETSGGSNISRMQGLRNALDSLQGQMATIETQFNMTEEGKRKRVRWAIIPFSMMVNAGLSRNSADTSLYSRNSAWFNVTGTYLKNGTTSTNPTHDSNWLSNTWDGCVEERRTSNQITANSTYYSPVYPAAGNLPSNTFDLDFEATPTASTDTRWTMADPARSEGQYACPKYMRELAPLTTSQFDDYFAFNRGFVANGGTYLDIGMLWAARLLSRNGLWSAENPTLYHTFPVSRYVIFMTDGVMDNGDNYSAYPHEPAWKRISSNGNTDTAKANHYKRLSMTCTAIKNMDVKIYAISFSAGSDLSTDLINCSSSTNTTNPEFAYKADDSDELDAVFRDIGENIGSLRLSQ
jgi:Flp pilus assembly protein TadG